MAPSKTDKPATRRRNRKARTEVSSSSSSASDASSSDSNSNAENSNLATQHQGSNQAPSSQQPSAVHLPPLSDSDGPAASNATSASTTIPQQGPSLRQVETQRIPFEQFYLEQATKEFADDLEKLRNAGDFRGQRSVEVLVRGLKGGVACFEDDGGGGEEEEKKKAADLGVAEVLERRVRRRGG